METIINRSIGLPSHSRFLLYGSRTVTENLFEKPDSRILSPWVGLFFLSSVGVTCNWKKRNEELDRQIEGPIRKPQYQKTPINEVGERAELAALSGCH